MVGAVDHHHCLDGGADCVYPGICGCAVYLQYFLGYVKNNICNFLIVGLSVLIGIAVCESGARIIGLGRPILYTSDNLVGYRPRPSQSELRRKGATVTINEEGFRIDPAKYKESSRSPIVFVGDSVTYGGSYIDDSDTFSALYCGYIDNSVCLNSGVNSWGIYNAGRFISNFEVYSSVKPSRIILVVLPGDLSRNFRSFSDTPFWDSHPIFPSGINEVLSYVTWRYFLPSLRSKAPEKTFEELVQSRKKDNLQNQLAWEDMVGFISKANYKIDVVITPPLSWFNEDASPHIKSRIGWFNKKLKKLKDLQNVGATCNLHQQILLTNPSKKLIQSFFVDEVHLSVKGHEEWAYQINKCFS